MLKQLMKNFLGTPSEEVSNEAPLAQEGTGMNEQLTQALAQVQELTSQLDTIKAQYADVKAALDANEEARKLLEAQAKQKRLEARTKAITEAVGSAKVETLLAATDALGDDQFTSIVSALATSFEAEAKSPMFQEQGVGGEAEAPAQAEESAEMALLKAKYA